MTPRPGRRDLLGRLSLFYLAAILLLVALQAIVGDRHWLGALLVYVPKTPLLLPALLLGIVALATRSGRAMGLNAVSIAACALGLMHLEVPNPARGAPGSGTPLRVMTFNIHFGAAGAREVGQAIRAASPDLILLQEMKAGPGVANPTPAIWRELTDWRKLRAEEYLIAARVPFHRRRMLSLGVEQRRLLAADVVIGGRRIALYNVHFATALHGQSLGRRRGSLPAYLNHTAELRQTQAAALARILERERGPILVAGDFNSPPGSHSFRRLPTQFTDAFAAAGWGFGFTFPDRLPLLRIDYLLASPEFTVRRCRVIRTGVSDHCAVVADLLLRE